MQCKKCGHKLKRNELFCTVCGYYNSDKEDLGFDLADDEEYVYDTKIFCADSDGDGLSDAFEYLYMTDKENVDTDGDGLSDYIEVMYLDYNPLSNDTFKDGINDGDRDYDNDKLTNIEEVTTPNCDNKNMFVTFCTGDKSTTPETFKTSMNLSNFLFK